MPSSRNPEAAGDAARGADARTAVEAVWQGLRACGVRLTPQQLIFGFRLVDLIDDQGGADPGRLKGMLSGVFAKSAADLDLFEQLFDAQFEAETAAGPSTSTIKPPKPPPSLPVLIASAELGMAAVAEVGAVVLSLWPKPPSAETKGQAEGPPPPPAESFPQSLGVKVREETRTSMIAELPPWWPAAQGALIAAPMLLIVALLLWRRSSAPHWTRLAPHQQEALLETALPQPAGANIFTGPALRTVAWGLRRTPPAAGARQLDVQRTLMATARNSGRLSPVFTAAPRRRSLHLAVERRSQEDHLAQLYGRAAAILDGYGVRVRLFSFREDIRVLNDEDGRAVSAGWAAGSDAEPTLAIVGDGEGFFAPVGRRLDEARWKALDNWDRRFLLSIRRTLSWGWREERMVSEGLSVSAANGAGFETMAVQLEQESPRPLLTPRSGRKAD